MLHALPETAITEIYASLPCIEVFHVSGCCTALRSVASNGLWCKSLEADTSPSSFWLKRFCFLESIKGRFRLRHLLQCLEASQRSLKLMCVTLHTLESEDYRHVSRWQQCLTSNEKRRSPLPQLDLYGDAVAIIFLLGCLGRFYSGVEMLKHCPQYCGEIRPTKLFNNDCSTIQVSSSMLRWWKNFLGNLLRSFLLRNKASLRQLSVYTQSADCGHTEIWTDALSKMALSGEKLNLDRFEFYNLSRYTEMPLLPPGSTVKILSRGRFQSARDYLEARDYFRGLYGSQLELIAGSLTLSVPVHASCYHEIRNHIFASATSDENCQSSSCRSNVKEEEDTNDSLIPYPPSFHQLAEAGVFEPGSSAFIGAFLQVVLEPQNNATLSWLVEDDWKRAVRFPGLEGFDICCRGFITDSCNSQTPNETSLRWKHFVKMLYEKGLGTYC